MIESVIASLIATLIVWGGSKFVRRVSSKQKLSLGGGESNKKPVFDLLLAKDVTKSLSTFSEGKQYYFWNFISIDEKKQQVIHTSDLDWNWISSLPNRMLIHGHGGIGKSTLLQMLVSRLNSKQEDVLYLSGGMFKHITSLSGKQTDQLFKVVKEVSCHRKLKLILFDGIEECCYESDNIQIPKIINTILTALLSSKSQIVCTIRTEYMQKYDIQNAVIGWTLFKISEWNDDQIERFTNGCGIKQHDYHLKSVLGIPFYADLFIQSFIEQTDLITKRKLVESALVREVTKFFGSDTNIVGVLYKVLEQTAWLLSTEGKVEYSAFQKMLSEIKISTELANKVSDFTLLNWTLGELRFQHDIYREYFTARYIENSLLENGTAVTLSKYQTTYEEDSFIADRANVDKVLKSILQKLPDQCKDEIGLVNIAGILAKIPDSKCLELAVKLVRKRKAIMERYRGAVDRRLNSANSESPLLDEIENGRDPLAGYFALEALNESSDFERGKKLFEAHYGVNFILLK